jgi:hypothetical protein
LFPLAFVASAPADRSRDAGSGWTKAMESERLTDQLAHRLFRRVGARAPPMTLDCDKRGVPGAAEPEGVGWGKKPVPSLVGRGRTATARRQGAYRVALLPPCSRAACPSRGRGRSSGWRHGTRVPTISLCPPRCRGGLDHGVLLQCYCYDSDERKKKIALIEGEWCPVAAQAVRG